MSLDNEGFRKRIKEYRLYFQLTQKEVATFMGWQQSDYSQLENGKRVVDLDTINLIALIYGLKGWQLSKADTEKPSIEDLPPATRKLVEAKLALGKKSRSGIVDLPKEIRKVLASGKLPTEFTSKNVYDALTENVKKLIAIRRVTDNLSRGACSKLVIYIDKKIGKEKLYSLNK